MPPKRAEVKLREKLQAERNLNFQRACIAKRIWPHLKVQEFDGRGRGLVATKAFSKGTVICHYEGKIYEGKAARLHKQKTYQEHMAQYVYEIGEYEHKYYVIDATKEDSSQGRLINHSIHPNLKPTPTNIDGHFYLLFEACRDVNDGDELVYDYGQRPSKDRCSWLGSCPLPSCSKCLSQRKGTKL